jgi:hypothetical protein
MLFLFLCDIFNECIKFYNIYFLIFKFYSPSNLMPNFITKISNVEFLSNFKVAELELEPGDYGGPCILVKLDIFAHNYLPLRWNVDTTGF